MNYAMKRRAVLAASAASVGLMALGWQPKVLAQPAPSIPPSALDATALGVVANFVPAIVGDSMLPLAPQARKQAIEACAYGVGVSVGFMPPQNQQAVRGLFAFLGQGPQAIHPSLPKTWTEMSPQAMQAVLQGLRFGENPEGRAMYAALIGLIAGAWYSSPQTWNSINYPGPLPL